MGDGFAEGLREGLMRGASEGLREGIGEGARMTIGVTTTSVEMAFWVDVELTAIEAATKKALKSPFPIATTILFERDEYRVFGFAPERGTLSCVVASMA